MTPTLAVAGRNVVVGTRTTEPVVGKKTLSAAVVGDGKKTGEFGRIGIVDGRNAVVVGRTGLVITGTTVVAVGTIPVDDTNVTVVGVKVVVGTKFVVAGGRVGVTGTSVVVAGKTVAGIVTVDGVELKAGTGVGDVRLMTGVAAKLV